MQITDTLIKPITETKYLNAENTMRYRCIMRIFYENYEKLRYWLYLEDIYEELTKNPYFAQYRIEQCQQDLAALTEWKNLQAMQDIRKVSTLEEFKNKKFRYQMSKYSVEIERLVIRLENLHIEGSSLEPTLLERLRRSISQMEAIAAAEASDVYTWWTDLNHDFVRLNQNYQDYIHNLNSIKTEEMMQTTEFLVFKDRLVEYLHSFIRGLQRNVGVIEEYLKTARPDCIDTIIQNVIAHEKTIPRMDGEVSEEMLESVIRGRYESIYRWFAAENESENEAVKLFDATNEIIRRITRYAAQLSEKNALGANRREEYRKAAEIFLKCQTEEEAHCMAAMVFGLESPYHIEGEAVRDTDSMNHGVYEETPMHITLKPRIRSYREKAKRSGITELSEKKLETKQKMIAQQLEDMRKIQQLEKDGEIDFANLPVLSEREREILLKWISNAMESTDFSARTDEGRQYHLKGVQSKKTCSVYCEDGIFTMPHMKIVFERKPS